MSDIEVCATCGHQIKAGNTYAINGDGELVHPLCLKRKEKIMTEVEVERALDLAKEAVQSDRVVVIDDVTLNMLAVSRALLAVAAERDALKIKAAEGDEAKDMTRWINENYPQIIYQAVKARTKQ